MAWVTALVGLISVPIAIGIAVLRYRLYEIDYIISRTLSWAAITSVLVVAFVGLVLGLTSMLGSVAGGSTFAVAGSTLVVFALFQPLRRRIQVAVDRRLYGPATTRDGPPMHLPSACGMTWTWPRSRATCWASSSAACSQPQSPSGCAIGRRASREHGHCEIRAI